MLGFVEHGDVRLDPVLIDQPIQHLGRSIGGVADQLGRIEIEACERALDHALCRQHFGLTDRRRRFDIYNDRVVGIDQVVGRIGKECWPAVRRGPPRRRISRCDELARHLGSRAERGIIEDGEIFFDGAAGRVRRQTRGTLNAAAVAGIGLDQAGVDGKAFTADQPLGDAAPQHALEQPPQQVAVAKAAVAVLREGRVDVTIPVEPEAAAVLADARNRKAVGRLVSRVLRPRSGPSPLAQAIAELKAEARAAGLSDADIDVEFAAYNAERRDRSGD